MYNILNIYNFIVAKFKLGNHENKINNNFNSLLKLKKKINSAYTL